ncbi:MAG: malto-oligosyltrehalose trehalohydrolase [Betaproteobacteria bacterium RIFCSPLOWO2_12_FULL_62_58]|nr:MAG: malto-oligosyltrehalose trehalohydrolase [Betaproteobacteria bacterium RIFCSPLOWO2_12_FULL_62_58]
MKRRHRMPFGAQLDGERGVRFRLWAPGVQAVELCLEGPQPAMALTMASRGEGWFGLTTRAALPGTRYRFRVGGEHCVPDPASRCNPQDVHGASEVIDPDAYAWRDDDWLGRPWREAVIYELHVGAFTPEGTFKAAARRLPYLQELGVAAVELMPVADFPGARNWGYDGVLPFAPDSRYGRPEDMKRLVNEAHRLGLMVLLDVVYNHFGPDGNYLHVYARGFFSARDRTPWGAAIGFDAPGSRVVRDFFIHNALYWLEEFHLDGLRLDAVDTIVDHSQPHILTELAEAVREGPGRTRHVHLVLENDDNAARYLDRDPDGAIRWYDAQWNDDAHHAFHILLTGESDGYYADYAEDPTRFLGRCFAEGYAYQGEISPHRGHRARGEPSANLPPAAFVFFLQTHDQIGNRANGERLVALADEAALRAATAAWLLAPAPPMLFMGEEFGAVTPFLYFCDFTGELAAAVRDGRRREFAQFERFADPVSQAAIPDPNDPGTFGRSKLDWDCIGRLPHARWLAFYRRLLGLRRDCVVPRLAGMGGNAGHFEVLAAGALGCEWRLGDGSQLRLWLNLSPQEVTLLAVPAGALLACEPAAAEAALAARRLPARSAACYLAAKGQ